MDHIKDNLVACKEFCGAHFTAAHPYGIKPYEILLWFSAIIYTTIISKYPLRMRLVLWVSHAAKNDKTSPRIFTPPSSSWLLSIPFLAVTFGSRLMRDIINSIMEAFLQAGYFTITKVVPHEVTKRITLEIYK